MNVPTVFLSAVTNDFGLPFLDRLRTAIHDSLGCVCRYRGNLKQGTGILPEKSKGEIESADCVIHLVGPSHGFGPVDVPQADLECTPAGEYWKDYCKTWWPYPDLPARRSYTQMEYDFAVQLRRPVYVIFVDDPALISAAAASQDPGDGDLQALHRSAIKAHGHEYLKVDSVATIESIAEKLPYIVQHLKAQIAAYQREQAEVRREVVATRRFGVKAFAAVMLALSLIGGGLWWVNHRQDAIHDALKMDAPALRARLAEASERTLQADLAEAAKETRWTEKQRLTEAAEAEHHSRLARIDDLANRLVELSADSESSPVLREMTRILEAEGVDASLAYVETQREDVLAEVRAAREAERQRNRTKLEPLLQAAGIQRTKGLNDEARAAYAELIELEPDWPEALSAYAYFLYDRSIHAQSYGTLETALADAEESHRLAQRLNALDGDNLEAQRLLSMSLNKLGNLAVAQVDLPGAARRFTESLAIAERLAASDPANAEWQRDRVVSLNKLGDLAVAQGDLPGAARRFTESHAIRERLAARDPANAAWQRDLSVSLDRLGDLAVKQGDLPGAARRFTESLAIRERLAASDPANAEGQRDLSVSLNKLGNLAVAQGDLPGAAGYFAKDLAIAERLAASDPANAEWQRDLAVSHYKLGQVAQGNGDTDGAVAAVRACFAVLERMKQRGMHLDPQTAKIHAQLAGMLGQ